MKPIEEQFAGDKATIEFLNAQKPSSRNIYKHHWRRFLEFTEMTGNQILEDRQKDKEFAWEKKVITFRGWLLDQKLSTASAKTAVGTVRSFFGFHRMELKFRRGEARRLTEHQRKYEDYVFTRDDLQRMAQVADLQGKYVVTAGKSFGLRVGDFRRMTRGDLEPYLDREVPISIGAYGTKKEMVKAYPFIDSDALPIIRLMIAQMDREGRTAPTDRILTLKSNVQLSRILKSLATEAGINVGNMVVRFHCLRKFLIDRLSSVTSESKWKQIVGKKISEKAYVSEMDLAECYAKAMSQTCWTGLEVSDRLKTAKNLAKTLLGATEAEIQEWFRRCDAKTPEEQTKVIDDEIQKHFMTHERNPPIGGGLPFEIQAKKALAEIILGAFEEIKKRQKTGEES